MDFEINIRKIIIEGAGILLLSMAAGISYNSLSNGGIPLVSPSITSENQSSSSQDEKSGNLRRITLKEAYKFFDSGEAIFLDARPEEAYKKGHIKNAMNISYTLPIKKKFEIISSIPKDVPLIAYCDGAECNASEGLAIELAQLGYTRVMIFFGGWNEWQKARYPVEK